MISTWIDLVLWLDGHEGEDGKLEVALSPWLQELIEMAHGDVNDSFRLPLGWFVRRNLDPMQFKLPVGWEYELTKQIHGGNRQLEGIIESSGHSDHLKRKRL